MGGADTSARVVERALRWWRCLLHLECGSTVPKRSEIGISAVGYTFEALFGLTWNGARHYLALILNGLCRYLSMGRGASAAGVEMFAAP